MKLTVPLLPKPRLKTCVTVPLFPHILSCHELGQFWLYVLLSCVCYILIQGDQKVPVHLMITIQKVTSNVMFKVSPASLQTFIYTPNCVLEDPVQYSTVHIPNIFCDGHLQLINCMSIVFEYIEFFIAPQRKKSGGERSGDLGGQMVLEMILSANTSSKSATDICAA